MIVIFSFHTHFALKAWLRFEIKFFGAWNLLLVLIAALLFLVNKQLGSILINGILWFRLFIALA